MRAIFSAAAVLAALLFPARSAFANGCTASAGVVQGTTTITGTSGDDVINCSAATHGHTITGGGGTDTLTGSSYADVFVPGDGVDTVAGGGGADTVSFSDATGPVATTITGAANDGFGNDETAQYTGIERLWGSSFADTITGNGGTNVLKGMDGNDTLAGAGGADVVDGGAGVDTATFPGASQGITASLKAGTARGQGADQLLSIENLVGTPYHDVLTGNGAANRLEGLGYGDVLLGGSAGDQLIGGWGNDTLFGGDGGDSLDGGSGTDACLEGKGAGTKTGCESKAFGDWGGMPLFQPSWSVVGVGFHESLFSTAVGLHPDGHLVLNDSPTRFTPPAEETDGLSYVVMASRGRPAPATSSADIVVGSSSAVLSPVTGTVVLVRQYLLYCQQLDWQILIRPDGNPNLLVMVLHTINMRVAKGSRVVASVTRLSTSWTNDSSSAQENDYFPDQYPHVHIELENATSVGVPGCLLTNSAIQTLNPTGPVDPRVLSE